jgi:hypothetical protein
VPNETVRAGGTPQVSVNRRKRAATALAATVGVGGSALCSFGVVAAAVGLFAAEGASAAHTSMAGMRTRNSPGPSRLPQWLDAIVRFRPEILVVSLLLVVAGVALRRRSAAIPAVVGGVVLYVGMYVQKSLILMYVAIGVGGILLLLGYVVSLRSGLLQVGRPAESRL